MRRRPSLRELTADLSACVESDCDDDQELERLLSVHGSDLAQALGCAPSDVARLGRLGRSERSARLRALVRAARERRQQLQSSVAQNAALAAATMMSKLAVWSEGEVRLDPRIVLGGGLLGDRSRRFVRFEAESLGTVTLRREKLGEAARALRFADLRCWLEGSRLNFGWRDGRGGLRLNNQSVGIRDADAILLVLLERPRPKVVEPLRRVALPTEPRWLADGLSDLGLF